MNWYVWFFILLAISAITWTMIDHEARVQKLEVLNRPLANCIEPADLYRNRPYPPAHGQHSYSKPVPVCNKVS